MDEEMIEEIYDRCDDDVVFLIGFDECIAGYSFSNGLQILIYDVEKIIDVLEDQGMTEEEAIEYFEFNIESSHIGERTPIFLNKFF